MNHIRWKDSYIKKLVLKVKLEFYPYLICIESLTENSPAILQFIRIEFNKRILEVFCLGDDPIAIGVVTA